MSTTIKGSTVAAADREDLAVIYLHSNGGTPAQWAAMARRIGGRVFLPALPGHGDNQTPAPGSIEAMAAALLPQIAGQGISRAIVIGHSAGASVAIALADAGPELVAGLVLCDPPGDLRKAPREPMDAFLSGLQADYRPAVEQYWQAILEHSKPDTRTMVMADLESTPPQSVIAVLEAMRAFDPLSPLERFSGPVVNIVSPLNALPISLEALLPSLRTVHIEEVSHWVHLDAPDPVAAEIMRVIAEVEQA